jgi:FkbM family methyltransferase
MVRDIRSGTFAEPEIGLISRIVSPGDTVIDIGANYGMYTYALCRAVGPTGHVWAFEPIPFTVDTLRVAARLLRLSNVEIVAKGCGDRTGTAVFHVPLQDNGAISAGQAHAASRNDDRPGRDRHAHWPRSRTVACEIVALDEFLSPMSRLSLVKADIEGAELSALRGAERLIDEHHPTVICEINPWFLDGFGLGESDLLGFFADKGYGIYQYLAGKLHQPREIEEDNYLFVHPTRLAALADLITS